MRWLQNMLQIIQKYLTEYVLLRYVVMALGVALFLVCFFPSWGHTPWYEITGQLVGIGLFAVGFRYSQTVH